MNSVVIRKLRRAEREEKYSFSFLIFFFSKKEIQIPRVGGKQSDEGRGWGLRKKKRGEGREAEGVETEHEEKKETGMRPNAGRHKCFRAGAKRASSQPT